MLAKSPLGRIDADQMKSLSRPVKAKPAGVSVYLTAKGA